MNDILTLFLVTFAAAFFSTLFANFIWSMRWRMIHFLKLKRKSSVTRIYLDGHEWKSGRNVNGEWVWECEDFKDMEIVYRDGRYWLDVSGCPIHSFETFREAIFGVQASS